MATNFHVPQYAGIHLAGVNSPRTAVVTLSGHPLKKSLKLEGLYEKISHFGNQFSDDRLLEIIRLRGPFDRVFVDCPISVPPCVECVRPICPGFDACEDLNVAYMMSLAHKVSSRRKRRRRSLNPQVQRLWDVYRLSRDDSAHFEPTYSNNNVSQAIRARGLQKRLSGLTPDVELEETSVALSLLNLSHMLNMDQAQLRSYRNFSSGLATRDRIVESLVRGHWLNAELDEVVVKSVDVFEALITALVAAMVDVGLCENYPPDYADRKQWVNRPRTLVELTTPDPA